MLHRSSNGGLHRSGGLVAPKSRCGRDAGGFSLLEILVVLALCGLISALLLGGGGALLRTVTTDDVQNTALGAIAGARHQAVLTGRTLEFTVNDQTRVLDWGAGRAPLAGTDTVRLLPVVRASASLVGGRLVETPLDRVRFYADGTCDPFRLEIVRDQASQILDIDPWTCAVLSPGVGPGSR
jgi:prepilin-type N-terminal cleavage/methylation domain-containing protein